MDMLMSAVKAAIHMPQLETLEIWNGRENLAALFRYQIAEGLQPSIIT
jgi:hypothetical protein